MFFRKLSLSDVLNILSPSTQSKGKLEEGDSPSSYHISSLNESKAKHICRKQPNSVTKYPFISFTDLL